MPGADHRLRVLVADDQVVSVRGAVFYLGALDLDVCGTLDDPRRLVTTYTELRPDVVVIEPIMGPRGAALAHVRELIEAFPDAHVLVLTAELTPVMVEASLEHGCLGVVPKTCSVAALGTAVRAVATGERHLHPRAIAALLTRRQNAESSRATKALSARELTVLSRVAEGLTNMEIGVELGISADTVKTHLARTLDKLNARDRTHAVARALRLGLFD
ncbi:MAG: response regulator transcription factor [Acidimicrobiales bacterium]|nr:response regulator transcription factor [Acidimicrobiales bacterium]MCB9392737.1 response regulator transcription factor [Acidimicrobiaceae bacterium]